MSLKERFTNQFGNAWYESLIQKQPDGSFKIVNGGNLFDEILSFIEKEKDQSYWEGTQKTIALLRRNKTDS